MFIGMVVAEYCFTAGNRSHSHVQLLIMVFTYLTVVQVTEPEPERGLMPPREGNLERG
jgi:hypothetical protein